MKHWIDLTHPLSGDIPAWDIECGFALTDVSKNDGHPDKCQFYLQKIEMPGGVGTHVDAPAHCFSHGKTIDELPLETLISPCIVMDVSKEAHELYLVQMPAIRAFEDKNGPIAKDDFVIFFTGWSRYWDQREKYHNNYRFPGLSQEVAEYLVSQEIRGIGIDTLSPDRPDSGYPVHRLLLGAGIYIVENVANGNLMPKRGGSIFVVPIPIKGGTEAPVRLFGCYSSL